MLKMNLETFELVNLITLPWASGQISNDLWVEINSGMIQSMSFRDTQTSPCACGTLNLNRRCAIPLYDRE